MPLEVIRGAAGAGKSEACYASIAAHMQKGLCQRAIMVVPDQCSFNAEKNMTARFGGLGLNGIEVMTFSRLVSRFGRKKAAKYLTPAGKQMLVLRAVLAQDGKENIFRESFQKPGFIDAVADMLQEFKRYMVAPEALLKQAERCESALLKQKLQALAAIYETYLDLARGQFLDSEEDLPSLAAYIETTDIFSGTGFWFDEFSDFLPQHYLLLRALVKKAQSVHVALALPENADAEVYQVPLATLGRLRRCCGAGELRETAVAGAYRHIASEELAFFAAHYNDWTKSYPHKTKDIRVFQARDLYAEVEHLAGEITALVQSGAYRYRDISVLCGREEQYSHIIEAVFRDSGIPYYTDLKDAVTEHPIIVLVLALFEIQTHNWSYDAVFQFLRTGFLYRRDADGTIERFPEEELDLLENYVLKHGIRGEKAWFSPWEETTGGAFGGVLDGARGTDGDMEQLNRTREAIIQPFAKYLEQTKGRKTVREIAGALFGFLEDIRLYEGLTLEMEELNGQGLRNEAEQYGLIWNLLMDVLDQMVVTMGDARCSKEEFGRYLQAGLSKCMLSIIPSGLDCVTVGSPDRSRQQHVKALFIIGAVQGELPREMATEGLLSDADRAALADGLAEEGLELAEDTKRKLSAETYKLFRSITAAEQKLFVSYPVVDASGTALRPAQLVWDLMKTFRQLDISDDVVRQGTTLHTPKRMFNELLLRGPSAPGMQALYAWFASRDEWRDSLQLIDRAAQYRRRIPCISPQDAEALYGKTGRYSVSRLNEFGKCPFAYFMKYGLRAQEQEVWQIQKFELGSLMHWAVCEYCKAVDGGAPDLCTLKARWNALTAEQSRRIIEEIMGRAEERVLQALRHDQKKVRYYLMRMQKILRRSVEVVRRSIAAGDYAAVCYEQAFQIHIQWKERQISLTGTIDRIDMAEDAQGVDLRVVDYKSGKKEFDIVSIYNKQDMQLIVYAIAALELYRAGAVRFAQPGATADIGGVLYNKLRDDIKVCRGTEEEAAKEAQKELQADGLVVLDETDGKYDLKGVYRTDRRLERGEAAACDFMKLKLKKDGYPDASSKVTSRERFRLLMDYVKKAAVDADRRIKGGEIGITPYCDAYSAACDYCPFGEICLHRETGGVPEKPGGAVWEKMREEVEE